MNRFIISLVCLIFSAGLSAQHISLLDCYEMACNNHPVSSTFEILEQQRELEYKIAGSSILPKAMLKANVSWQSDVSEVELPIPGFNMPELAHDWYKLYLDVTQTIYDGGLTKANRELTNAQFSASMQEQEVNLYQVKASVNIAFFSALQLQQQGKSLRLKKEVLAEQTKHISSAVKYGTIKSSELDRLKAEQILLDQQITEVESLRVSAIEKLSVLTGKNFTDSTILILPDNPYPDSVSLEFNRPELKLIDMQKALLDKKSAILARSGRPKIYGYGQAGYGRPGLNMFNDNFDDWYLVGIGLQWNIYDWRENEQKQQVIELQKALLDVQEKAFIQQLDLLITSKWNEIHKLRKIIASDDELIRLRKSVADQYASEFKHGVVNSAKYIRELNHYMASEIMSGIHQIHLLQATYEYLTIYGTNYAKNNHYE